MLFMGEEWAASTPWQFFTSHPEPELGEATARGRKAEFAAMGWDESVVPDPQDPETFQRSKLQWVERDAGVHARILALYRSLLQLRRAHADLSEPRFRAISAEADEERRWFRLRRGTTEVLVNFADEPVTVPAPETPDVHLATDPRAYVVDGRAALPARSAVVLSDRGR